jgi:hypothetical protein
VRPPHESVRTVVNTGECPGLQGYCCYAAYGSVPPWA